jgi:Arc/MetJ family transcription regulator
MAANKTSIRVNARLADEAKKILGVKSWTEAVHLVLTKLVSLSRFKALMRKNAGKLSFAALSK